MAAPVHPRVLHIPSAVEPYPPDARTAEDFFPLRPLQLGSEEHLSLSTFILALWRSVHVLHLAGQSDSDRWSRRSTRYPTEMAAAFEKWAHAECDTLRESLLHFGCT